MVFFSRSRERCGWRTNHDRPRVYDARFSFLNDARLGSDAYRQAQRRIRQSALNGGVPEQTRQNADRMPRPRLAKLAGRRVGFVFRR